MKKYPALTETMRLLMATWICMEQLKEDDPAYFHDLFSSALDKNTGKTLYQTVSDHIQKEGR